MVEVQGNSVRLYLEGLMFFALDEERKQLKAGILNVDDGHNLRVRTFNRKPIKTGADSDEVWEKGVAESISDAELRLYDQGEITVLSTGGVTKDITSPIVPRNHEIWTPFNLIPKIEDIVGSGLMIDRKRVKPVLSITGGEFFSVLKPDHVEDAKPLEKKVATRGFLQTYRLKQDQVAAGKKKACGKIKSLKDLLELGVEVEDLAIRTYSAATIISLSKGEELICVLTSSQFEQRLVFRVKYHPNLEAKIVIENAFTRVKGAHVHSHAAGGKSDPADFFHSLCYYDAVNELDDQIKYILANEEMLLGYVNSGDEPPVPGGEGDPMTGGNDPSCPAVIVSSDFFAD